MVFYAFPTACSAASEPTSCPPGAKATIDVVVSLCITRTTLTSLRGLEHAKADVVVPRSSPEGGGFWGPWSAPDEAMDDTSPCGKSAACPAGAQQTQQSRGLATQY